MTCVPNGAQRKGTAERRTTKGTELGRGRGARLRRGQRGRGNRAFVRRQLSISQGEEGHWARCADVLDEPGAGDDQADNVVKIRIIIDAVTPDQVDSRMRGWAARRSERRGGTRRRRTPHGTAAWCFRYA